MCHIYAAVGEHFACAKLLSAHCEHLRTRPAPPPLLLHKGHMQMDEHRKQMLLHKGNPHQRASAVRAIDRLLEEGMDSTIEHGQGHAHGMVR